ncbi:UNVERIFIED_ORG: hypothetical protein ABIC97_003799 [Peribacillus simplex]
MKKGDSANTESFFYWATNEKNEIIYKNIKQIKKYENHS